MSDIEKYKLTFPPITEGVHTKIQIRAKKNQLTFMIGNIKCRTQAIVYFKFYGFDYHNDLIAEYTSDRWIVSNAYELRKETFELDLKTKPNSDKKYTIEDLDNFYMELYTLGIDSENPLYFNHLQLNDGEQKEYNIPNSEIENVNIGFNKNSYVNLYDEEDTFLQVIRPNHEGFSTEQLTGSQMTILAPHIPNEPKWDDPIALFYEFMYMKDQKIGVEK